MLHSSLPSLRAVRVGGLCLEILHGTWGPDPVLHQFFAIQNRRSFPTPPKNIYRNGLRLSPPKEKASKHRPPTRTALDTEQVISDPEKNIQKWVRLSLPKEKTSRHRPPTRTALELGSEDSYGSLVEHTRTLSKFCGDPCPVSRGLAATVKCDHMREKHFFSCVGSETHHYRLHGSRVSVR